MSVYSLRPRVCDLVYRLYGRPLHPELFEILAQRKIVREEYEVSVFITRTGHVITWEDDDVFLTEVTTESTLVLPEKRRLLNYRLRGEHTGTFQCAHDVNFQMSFQVESLEPEIFLHVHDEILAEGGKRGLLHNFQPNHRLAVSPLGCVEIDARPDCVFLSTFHTFPEENTIVKTQSLVEKRH